MTDKFKDNAFYFFLGALSYILVKIIDAVAKYL